jgi:hypothetical protein
MVMDRLPREVSNNPFFECVSPLLPDIFGGGHLEMAWNFAVFGLLDSCAPKRGAYVDWEIVDDDRRAWEKLMKSPGHEFWEGWFRDRGFTFMLRSPWEPDDLASVVDHRAFSCALRHDLFSSSALAIGLVLDAIDAPADPPPRLVFGPDGKTVCLDGVPFTIKNKKSLTPRTPSPPGRACRVEPSRRWVAATSPTLQPRHFPPIVYAW